MKTPFRNRFTEAWKLVLRTNVRTTHTCETRHSKSHTSRVNLPKVRYIIGKDRAYFSVQYCTLCAVLIKKCAVLNAKVCSIEI